jgi:hypothetical protein
MILKSILVRKNPTRKRGMLISNLFRIGPCLKFRKSATISRALRKAVSPDVIGAATTPSNASPPPTLPRSELEISFTINAAFP